MTGRFEKPRALESFWKGWKGRMGLTMDSQPQLNCLYLPIHFVFNTSASLHPSFLALVISTRKPTKRPDPLRLGPLQTPHVQSQSRQNSRPDLLRADLLPVLRLLEVGIAQNARNVPVILVQTAVLGNLLRAGGVDDAVLRGDDDIWGCRVCSWVAKTLGWELGPGDDVDDLEASAVGIKVVDGCYGIFLVLEPYESDVVRGLLDDLYLCGIHDQVGIDLSISSWVDRSIAVFRGNNDEGLMVDVFVFKFLNNLGHGGVDEVVGRKETWRKGVAEGILVAALLFSNVD